MNTVRSQIAITEMTERRSVDTAMVIRHRVAVMHKVTDSIRVTVQIMVIRLSDRFEMIIIEIIRIAARNIRLVKSLQLYREFYPLRFLRYYLSWMFCQRCISLQVQRFYYSSGYLHFSHSLQRKVIYRVKSFPC